MTPHAPAPVPDAFVLYDGECTFCRRCMRFVKQRDRHGCFILVALQSESGHALLRVHQLSTEGLDSVVLIEGPKVSLRSTAILRICRRLSGAWPLLYAAVVVPRPLRDWLYAVVARRRNQ